MGLAAGKALLGAGAGTFTWHGAAPCRGCHSLGPPSAGELSVGSLTSSSRLSKAMPSTSKDRKVQRVQKADLSHFTDAKTASTNLIKLSSQGSTTRQRHRTRVQTQKGLCCASIVSAGPEASNNTGWPSKGSWPTHKAEVATGPDGHPPPPPLGWPCFHRFFPAGAGFLPSQECAPRMSILISPAL